MTAQGERVARGTNKAFATPWDVCCNVAYPPPQSLKTTTYQDRTAAALGGWRRHGLAGPRQRSSRQYRVLQLPL